jgi:uncharacterized protein (DUF305 family)
MRKPTAGLILLILVPVLVLTALTQDSRVSSASTAWSDLTTIMEKMHLSMASVKPSGVSDKDFVALMVPHHQAAIEMAKAELLNGNDAQMRRLAQEIIADQQSEIDLMQLWLKQHPAQKQ